MDWHKAFSIFSFVVSAITLIINIIIAVKSERAYQEQRKRLKELE